MMKTVPWKTSGIGCCTAGRMILLIAIMQAAHAGWALPDTDRPTTASRSAPAPVVTLSFPGVAQTPTLDGDVEKPSDVHIAVGPGTGTAGRIVEVTNNGLQLFDKTGASVDGPVTLESFARVDANRCFDPKVLFDQHSRRFFVVMPETKSSRTSRLHVMVSKSDVPGNLTTDWFRTAADAVTTFGQRATWFDYPCLGADAASLFVTGNMSDDNKLPRGVKLRVFDKARLLEGEGLFTDLDLAAEELPKGGTFTVQPAHTFGRTGSGHFFLISRCGPEFYRLWEIAGAPAAPRIVANTVHPWRGGKQIRDGAPQKGSSGITLHTSSGRIMNALWRAGDLWCVATADLDDDGRTEVVWYRIRTGESSPAVPEVAASGSIGGGGEAGWTFVPSVGVNARGTAAICYAESSPDKFPEARVALRPAIDKEGRFGPSYLLQGSAGEYDNIDRHNPEKWADYSACVVDPDDEESFWVAHEFCRVARREGDDAEWGTFIARIDPVGEERMAGGRQARMEDSTTSSSP